WRMAHAHESRARRWFAITSHDFAADRKARRLRQGHIDPGDLRSRSYLKLARFLGTESPWVVGWWESPATVRKAERPVAGTQVVAARGNFKETKVSPII